MVLHRIFANGRLESQWLVRGIRDPAHAFCVLIPRRIVPTLGMLKGWRTSIDWSAHRRIPAFDNFNRIAHFVSLMSSNWYRTLALSNHPLLRMLRAARNAQRSFSLPAPRWLVMPFVVLYLAIRNLYYVLVRVLICEPFFKAHCTSYGKGLRTGVFLHWMQGRGRIVIGDNVEIDGKCSFAFAARFAEQPTLQIGGNTGIGHGCSFTVGKSITIGNHCRIAMNVIVFDSPGHPADPAARLADQALSADEVLPVVISDNVWVGQNALIFPGVTIGEGSIVAAGAVVMVSVPPNVLVAGNPARQVRSLIQKT